MDIALYAVLTWYFDNVIADEYGYRLPPWFCLTFDYWGIEVGARRGINNKEWLRRLKALKSLPVEVDEHMDVSAERQAALDEEYFPAVKVVNLRKVFGAGLGSNTMRDDNGKVAVRDLCMTFQEGKL